MLSYIPDGYTESAYIRAVPRLYNELRFEFRPLLVDQRNIIADAAQKAPPDKADRILAAAVAKRLVSWSLVDSQGNGVPIGEANVLRLKPALFSRVYFIVAGTDASDDDPTWTDAKKSAESSAILEAAIEGRPVGDVKEEADLKNSGQA